MAAVENEVFSDADVVRRALNMYQGDAWLADFQSAHAALRRMEQRIERLQNVLTPPTSLTQPTPMSAADVREDGSPVAAYTHFRARALAAEQALEAQGADAESLDDVVARLGKVEAQLGWVREFLVGRDVEIRYGDRERALNDLKFAVDDLVAMAVQPPSDELVRRMEARRRQVEALRARLA
jgi:hypothetical protein